MGAVALDSALPSRVSAATKHRRIQDHQNTFQCDRIRHTSDGHCSSSSRRPGGEAMAKRDQLEFALAPRHGWGGGRPRAGRKPGPHPRIAHSMRPALAPRFPCHVTLRVRRDVGSLRSAYVLREVERSWRRACDRGRFRLVHYSIQPDHVHMIVEAASSRDLACGVKSVAARLARAANRALGREGPVLADRYHARVLRSPLEVRNAIAYVLLNARRHAWKSGRWFAGWVLLLRRAQDPPVVASPRTWLLGLGWRQHGLLRLDEIPGYRRPRFRERLDFGGVRSERQG